MSDSQEVCRAFRNNGSCRFGEDCKFEHSEGEPIANPAPRARGECFDFRDGDCSRDNCRFSHGPNDDRPARDPANEVCRNYLRGRCKFGEDCHRKHEGEVVAQQPRQRNSRRPGVCFDFRDGNCDREDCRFSHDLDADNNDAPAPRQRKSRRPGVCFDFRDGSCDREDCRFSHDLDTDNNDAPTPRRRERKQREPSDEVCRNYRNNGECRFGDDCIFQHTEGSPIDISDEVCRNYLRGRCNNGDECPRLHEGEVEQSQPKPRRRKKKQVGECFDFRDGNCERGDECRFSHGGAPPANTTPPPRGECFDFRDGNCQRDNCRFSHGEE